MKLNQGKRGLRKKALHLFRNTMSHLHNFSSASWGVKKKGSGRTQTRVNQCLSRCWHPKGHDHSAYQSRKYSQISFILQIHWIQTKDEYRAHAAIRCGVLAQGSTLPTKAPLFLSESPRKSALCSHVMRQAFTTWITTGYWTLTVCLLRVHLLYLRPQQVGMMSKLK